MIVKSESYLSKVLLGIVFLINVNSRTSAQNLQIHYDYSEGREFITSTIEMLKPDDLGMTFFFVDFDYNHPKTGGISSAYWEIARDFALPHLKGLAVSLQYNDGLATWGPIGNVWLWGFSYPIRISDFRVAASLLYRHSNSAKTADFQFTAAWGNPILSDMLIFTGFIDIWTRDKTDKNSKSIVILAEPQLWYELGTVLAIGGELEISNNFLPEEDWSFKPTIAVKWQF